MSRRSGSASVYSPPQAATISNSDPTMTMSRRREGVMACLLCGPLSLLAGEYLDAAVFVATVGAVGLDGQRLSISRNRSRRGLHHHPHDLAAALDRPGVD